ERATALESDVLTGQGERSREASHYTYWLLYGYLQQGRFKDAERLLKAARDRLEKHPMGRERAYYGAMCARYLFDTGDWQSAAAWAAPEGVEIPAAHYHFAHAAAAIRRGDLDTSRIHAQSVVSGGEGHPDIVLDEAVIKVLHDELRAMSAFAKGDTALAVEYALQTAEGERALPFQYGPPQVVKPASELLGDLLLNIGRPEEAVNAYKEQLLQTPRRTSALLGLARAAKAAGDAKQAADAYRQLTEIWHSAEEGVPGYSEAKEGAGL
ncbi:MAG: tetratricopeptide repeat protein, partial [Candidatus Hydrogenedentales bacterium]